MIRNNKETFKALRIMKKAYENKQYEIKSINLYEI